MAVFCLRYYLITGNSERQFYRFSLVAAERRKSVWLYKIVICPLSLSVTLELQADCIAALSSLTAPIPRADVFSIAPFTRVFRHYE